RTETVPNINSTATSRPTRPVAPVTRMGFIELPGRSLRIAAREIRSVVRISAPFVDRDLRVRTEGARAVDNAVHGMRPTAGVGRDAAFHPLLERGLHVERIRTRPTETVPHPRRHEQPVKAL